MAEMLTPDLCVIGAGSGGLSVAAAAAAFGVPVVLIEKGRMGGDCLNVGCVPSKALIAAARQAQAIRDAARFGISTGGPPVVDFAAVRAHIHRVMASIAPTDSAARFAGLGVRVIAGHGRFCDPRTVCVTGDRADMHVCARRFVIATGSSPVIPPIPGLDGVPYLTNETVFDLTACPRHLLVIGGGAIGLELAQAFRRLGAAVTVIEAAAPLGGSDPEAVAIVLAALKRDGVVIRAGHTVQSIRPASADGGITIAIAGPDGSAEDITGSHLLVAVGRRPNVTDLGLDRASIAFSAKGIVVDTRLRTSNRRVYAIGDVIAGGQKFTHAANDQAGLVVRHALFRLPIHAGHRTIPAVTYTDPELAQVGLSEAQAQAAGHRINVLRWSYHDNDRARAEAKPEGHIKVITTQRGHILGATIIGAQAGELIATWTLAVSRKLHISALAGMTVAYPTYAEIGKRAAITFYGRSLTNALLRRIIIMLRRLG